MASASESSMKVCDLTQCSICLETFKEPKALPCIHTFCLQCLDKHCEGKEQEKLACPLCRNIFSVPPGGNKNLPNNFFIEQLLQLKALSDFAESREEKKIHLCDICSDGELVVTATSYCFECDQHICDRCTMAHKRTKVSKEHTVVGSDKLPSFEERLKQAISYCDQHAGQQSRFYCCDCNVVICTVCFEEKHNEHKLTNVNKSAEKFCVELKRDVEEVEACSLRKQREIERLEADTKKFRELVASAENEISKKCDELVSLIQSHKSQLLEELNEFKTKILKQVKTMKDEIERQFVIRESFKKYCEGLINKGTACDISRMAHDLHARAEELVKAQDEPDCHKLSGVEITFKPSLAMSGSDSDNLLGELLLKDDADPRKPDLLKEKPDLMTFLRKGRLVHVIPGNGHCVHGITVLGSEVFVVRFLSQVDVYDSTSFASTYSIDIAGSTQLRRIVSCSRYNCLYINALEQKKIYRYDLTKKTASNWILSGICNGLTLAKSCNVLVTLGESKCVCEYNTRGKLIRKISFDVSIGCPYSCVQLSTKNLLVFHDNDSYCQATIVDLNGQSICFDGAPDSRGKQMEIPTDVVVDAHDNFLVANSGNVWFFKSSLMLFSDIVIPGHKVTYPYSLHFDEENCCLYIGCKSGVENKCIFVLNVDMD